MSLPIRINAGATLYNLQKTLTASQTAKGKEMLETIMTFIRCLKEVFTFPDEYTIHLFLSPTEPLFTPDSVPFQIPVKGKRYRDDVIVGILWIESELAVEPFPYKIIITPLSIAFDAGPAESPEDSAKIVHEVIRQNNHVGVSSMTNPRNLMKGYALPLIPKSIVTAA